MKKWMIFGVVALFLTSCALIDNHQLYEVRMTNGSRLYAQSEPKLRDGDYVFDDVNGQQYIIKRSLVLYIEPTDFSR